MDDFRASQLTAYSLSGNVSLKGHNSPVVPVSKRSAKAYRQPLDPGLCSFASFISAFFEERDECGRW